MKKVKNAWLSAAMAACLLAPSSNLLAQGGGSFDLGVGLGIPYGVLGANFEFYPIENFSISAGLGTTILGETGYDLGLYYYFGREGSWNPRLSVHYGTNGILSSWWYDDETFEGISIGAGVKKLWGNHGLALDVFYIASSDLYDRVSALGFHLIVKIGIGYIYSF